MTIRELIEAAPFCDSAEIVIREGGRGRWIQGYRIGKQVGMWRSEHTVELHEGKQIWGDNYKMRKGEELDAQKVNSLPIKIIKKDVNKLPDNVMNLKVCSYQPRHIPSFHREQMTHNEFSLDIDAYPEGFIPEVKTNKQDSEELEGQMNIMDFLTN